jgi:UDP-N-acetylmuramoylalanine--D-glutamate ligase
MTKYAIAGYGLEGKSAEKYFKSLPNTEDILIFQNDDFENIPDDYVIIRSPGISPNKFNSQKNLWSSTNEFFKTAKEIGCKIIGVTGTKGKGTTCGFIKSILDQKVSNQNVYLVGNIGSPALDILSKLKPEDIVIFELSSFQLWDIKYSPDIAVITNIEVDHQDVHSSLDEYIDAKLNIVRFQNSDNYIIIAPDLHPLSMNIKLPGDHNKFNASLAIEAITALNIDINDEQIINGLQNFKGFPHRLSFVKTVNNVDFYDDSISTTPGSVIAAINSFSQPKVLIMGGRDKGADYFELAEIIENPDSNVKKVVLVGENSDKIAAAFSNDDLIIRAENINDAVQFGYKSFDKSFDNISEKSVVIMSPAGSSFDLYKDYKQRGEKFIEAVEACANVDSRLHGNDSADMDSCFRRNDSADVDSLSSELAVVGCRNDMGDTHRNDIRNIAVFDSGKGGEFVADALKKLQPQINFITYNDHKNVPYGNKTQSEIIKLTDAKIKPLIADNDIIIIACNTATAYAIDYLRETYPGTIFIGFEPMVKPAISLSKPGDSVVILATPATLNSKRYLDLKTKYGVPDIKIIEPNCEDWAKLIEENKFNSENLFDLKNILSENNVSQIVLACTHYIGIADLIQNIISDKNVNILQPIDAINQRINYYKKI